MKREQQEAIIEAVLFTMGESVEISKLAELIEENKKTTKKIVYGMKEKLQQSNRGIDIVELEDSFQMCTKTEMYEHLIKIAKAPSILRLTSPKVFESQKDRVKVYADIKDAKLQYGPNHHKTVEEQASTKTYAFRFFYCCHNKLLLATRKNIRCSFNLAGLSRQAKNLF